MTAGSKIRDTRKFKPPAYWNAIHATVDKDLGNDFWSVRHGPNKLVAHMQHVTKGPEVGKDVLVKYDEGTGMWAIVSGGRVGGELCFDYIVEKNGFGSHTTIQSALDDWKAAAAPKAIFICPGTYNEDLTIDSGSGLVRPIHIYAPRGKRVIVQGDLRINGQFSNITVDTWQPHSWIEGIAFEGGGGKTSKLQFGQTTGAQTTAVYGLGFRDCSWSHVFEILTKSSTDPILINRAFFENCHFKSGFNDNGRVMLWGGGGFTRCDFEAAWVNTGYSGASKSAHTMTRFTDCRFADGAKFGDLEDVIFDTCTFDGDASFNPCLWIAGGAGLYGPNVREVVISNCLFRYPISGVHGSEWSFIRIGDSQLLGYPQFDNLVVSDCVFDVPNLSSGDPPIHCLWCTGNTDGKHPHISFVGNAMIEDGDGNRLEDQPTSSPSTTFKGPCERSCFGPCVPPDFDVEVTDAGVGHNLWIGSP